MNTNTKKICITGLGIALYVAVSMSVKIPLLVGHIALDLGYIVLAVYCLMFGGVTGAIVGGAGCVLVSLLAYGMFPIGWMLGNIMVGFMCGKLYRDRKTIQNMIVSVVAVFIGVLVIKTSVECVMYGIPLAVKIPKNGIAFIADSLTMCVGVIVEKCIPKKYRKIKK